jgi:hypothetical protein
MLRGGHITRTRLGIVLAVAAGVVLGAVVGQPSTGVAARSATKPVSQTLPTIPGTAEVGVTLVATRGTWSGKPTSFHFAWVRCDTSGAACAGIPGATARAYTPSLADVGHTLRIKVTARNSSGSTTAISHATGIVPPFGCPNGTGTIGISQVSPPARLFIVDASVTPRVTRSTNSIRLHFKIEACGGRPVQGAAVFATPVPYNQFAVAQGTTGADGTVLLTEARRPGFPVSRQQRLLTVFARTWKQGEPVTGGVSSGRVVAFRFGHH